MRPSAAPAGAWLFAAGAGLLAGAALQLQQPALSPAMAYAALVALGAALVASGLWVRWRGSSARSAVAASPDAAMVALHPWRPATRVVIWAIAWLLLAFGATGWRATQRLAQAVPAALEGVDLNVVGVVAGLPQRAPGAWRFRFEVEHAMQDERRIVLPRQLSLGWYDDERGAPLPALQAGQRWQLRVRLKRPHGVANPHGFDYELLLFEQGVRATGYVRAQPAAANRLLASGVGQPVDRARQAVRDAIAVRLAAEHAEAASASGLGADDAGGPARSPVPDAAGRAAGVLAALAVGDQAAIEREDWALYRDTGVAHLMSISGLHVTMFAWLAGLACGALWRRSTRAMLRWPAPQAARWGGLAAALAYAVFAGWGVPAQRTVLMLAAVTLLGAAGLRWPWPRVWGAAMVVVVAVDPWALLQPGFWLSFAAVGLLMASGLSTPGGAQPLVAAASGLELPPRVAAGPAWLKRIAAVVTGGLRTQLIATLGLAPLTLVFFQQLSVVGFVANLLAIPLVTLLITPLALLGVLLPPLWTLAAFLVEGLNAALQWLAAPAWAVWSVPAAPAWAVAAALLASVLALLPLPWRVRVLALPLVLPLLAPALHRPPQGHFDLMAIDVGQGTGVLLRTATHTLLYDTGPQYSRESDAGERVVVPLLRALGERRLDVLMLSHRDTDHVGGAAAVLRALPVTQLSSSLEAGHPLRALAAQQGASVSACAAGQRWQWDGVDFELLHPDDERLAQAEARKSKPNTLSCVLQVRRAGAARGHGHGTALITGDLEREQELALVARYGAALKSEVLLVPHHGSKTSSSGSFLDAVGPRVAVVQAGYRNRFGHPAADVMARYAERRIETVQSPRCGAWQYATAADTARGEPCWRAESRRYWHHPDFPAPENGVEVAIPRGAIATGPAVP